MMQRQGYPNTSIKLFQNYDAWQARRFIELAGTFTTMTIRDGLNGKNEGLLQIYDSKNLHTRLNGDEILQISVQNANSTDTLNRLYGIKHSAASVDQKGDNIITFQLQPYYARANLTFSRALFKNATDSIRTMMNSIYVNSPNLLPTINGINVHTPDVSWTGTLPEYLEYVRTYGLSTTSDSFVFIWEDFYGLNIVDYESIKKQDIKPFMIGEPMQLGQFNQMADVPLAYDFEWLTRANGFMRDPYQNATIYTHSFLDKTAKRLVTGNGDNIIMVSRSGGYANQTYRNGYEEATRINTMAQFDSYAKVTTYGDFKLTPSMKVAFGDSKEQFQTTYYIDEVIHEISREQSLTHMYMFTNSKPEIPVDFTKEKNELKDYTTSEESPSESPGNNNS